MRMQIIRSLIVTAIAVAPAALNVGCSHEVSHTESDKPGWFGGDTHEETTVTKNPDGSTSVEKEKSSTP